MARSTEDLAVQDAVMNGTRPPQPRAVRGLRFGVAPPHSDNVSPCAADALDRFLKGRLIDREAGSRWPK
jgi:hypothetical protein